MNTLFSNSHNRKQNISLIFLDVDGVLNINDPTKPKKDKPALSVLRSHVERLADILKATDIACKICISSAWRLHKYALRYLKQQLVAMGHIDVEQVIIGETPSIAFNTNIRTYTTQRVREIQYYLQNDNALKSKYKVVSFCVIDDLDLSGIGMDHFVHINPRTGLTDNNVHRILSVLNNDSMEKSAQKLMILKSKPRVKLLFVAASANGYDGINAKRLAIIQTKTQCRLVVSKQGTNHSAYNGSLCIENFTEITKYATDLEKKYNVQSWAVLDYINISQSYKDHPKLITRRFVKVDPDTDLSINDVLATVSILNQWS